ncbi:MAG: tetratricopeptide repeat protein [Desulfobacterales bacterium]
MKTKTRNIKRGAAIFVILLSVSFIAGCYLRSQSEVNADYLMPEQKIKGVTKKDITGFMSSVKVRDGQAESNYKLGLYFQKRKRHNLAIEEFEKAVEQQPDMASAYNAMGISNDKLGKPSQALHCYQLAIKLDPQMDSAYNNLGYSYLLEDDLDAAIAAFQKAIALNDQNKRYRNNLGSVSGKNR